MRRPTKDVRARLPPASKDRKRWCGGHVGREHVEVLTLPISHPGWAGFCRPVPDWYTRTRMYLRGNRPVWWCFHTWCCLTCGKHVRPASADECPGRPERQA